MSALLTVMIAGNIALQVPLGLLAERWSARLVRLGCVSATVLGCVLLPMLIDMPLVWPFVFIWGAVSYGIYTMTIIELGERFSGQMLVAGNAAFAMMWGVGGIAAPPVAGAAMDVIGANGLPLALGLMCLLLAVLSVVRSKTYEEALKLTMDNPYGNGTAIFTRDGDAARDFAARVNVGMVGINVPVPVPLAYHSFGGWKASAFGDLNQHGTDAIKFWTRTKMVTARWPSGIKDGAEFQMPTMK